MTTATSPANIEGFASSTADGFKNRMDARCYDSIRGVARQLDFTADTAIEIHDLNRLAETMRPPVTTASQKPLHFVTQETEPAKLSYEAQIYATGAVPTRHGVLHDSFNALVWLSLPRTKAALNAHQVAAQQNATNSRIRTPPQDALTLFDECGVIVASDCPELLAMIDGFQWKTLFWERRAEVIGHMKFFLFGHGLMEQILNPYVGLTGKALLLEVQTAWLEAAPDMALSLIDSACRELIGSAGALSHGQELRPLPVLGIPGWAAENEAEAYYDNVQYFRPGRISARQRTK